MFGWLMNLFSKLFDSTAENNTDEKHSSGENWVGLDGTERGPGIPENWYLKYEGPMSIVEDIYEPNYGVDRGNGAIPIEFYINKWEIPDGFGNTDYERDMDKNKKLNQLS